MGKELRSLSEYPVGLDEERLGGRAKSVTVGFALLLLLGAGAFMFFVDDKPDPSKNLLPEFAFESKEVQEARLDEPEGLLQLQRLVLSPDPSVANQAAQKLTMGGESGWMALFTQLPSASAEICENVRTAPFGPGRSESAAIAIRSGPRVAREGAYIAVDASSPGLMVPGDPAAHERANLALYGALLTRVDTADKDEAETVFNLLKRYHPNTVPGIEQMLEHESPIVRAAGVHSLLYMRKPESITKVKALQSDPDPRVHAEVEAVLKSDREGRTMNPPGMGKPTVAPK